MILSVCVGVLIGAWLNYQTGLMTISDLPLPHIIMWPSWSMFGCLLVRTLLGILCVFLTRQVFTSLSYSFICMLLKQDEIKLKQSANTLQNKHKTLVELGCKYITCAMIGFNILYTLPQVFRFLKIERPTFFTEIWSCYRFCYESITVFTAQYDDLNFKLLVDALDVINWLETVVHKWNFRLVYQIPRVSPVKWPNGYLKQYNDL